MTKNNREQSRQQWSHKSESEEGEVRKTAQEKSDWD